MTSIDRLPWVLLLASGCASGGAPARPSAGSDWLPADTATGLRDPRLVELTLRYWADFLESRPLDATELGVHAFDDRIDDNSSEGIARTRAQHRAHRDALAAIIPTLTSSTDRTSAELLHESLEARIAGEVCNFHEWTISASSNPVTQWNYLPELHAVKTPEDGARLVARYRAIASSIDYEIGHLRRGLRAGKVANAESVRRVVAMVKSQLDQPPEKWPLRAPVQAPRPEWTEQENEAFSREIDRVTTREIQPALRRYLALLEAEIAPAARPSDKTGLSAVPGGEACYRSQIRRFTALDLDPAEVHRIGLEEIARLDAEIAALGQRALGTTDLASTLAKLRGDPSLYFTSETEIEAAARDALARAQAAVPKWFGILPRTECVVTRVPDYEAPYSTIAYYRQPVPDGSKPGQYFVNVHRPTTRPRFEAAVLAFHESVPGHHLQIAIAQERSALPAFRKHLDATAFVEGWALYTERLADEMGLYASDLDRLGMLSFDAWRASRLVVDTGIHAFGWSREKAVEFMLAHTALAPTNVANEVDRYIVWPGQALAYKTGQREILRLRADAEQRMGPRFSLPGFHDAVLSQGAVTLPVLGRAVEAWINGTNAP